MRSCEPSRIWPAGPRRPLPQQLARTGPGDVPAGFDQVCGLVERTEGVRFRELFERLPRRDESGDEALRTVLDLAGGAARADRE